MTNMSEKFTDFASFNIQILDWTEILQKNYSICILLKLDRIGQHQHP